MPGSTPKRGSSRTAQRSSAHNRGQEPEDVSAERVEKNSEDEDAEDELDTSASTAGGVDANALVSHLRDALAALAADALQALIQNHRGHFTTVTGF